MNQPLKEWKPSFKWQIQVLLIILVLATIGFFVAKEITDRLPASFAKKRPAAQTTPWLQQGNQTPGTLVGRQEEK